MTDWFLAYVRETGLLVFGAAPYLLLGFLVAGLLKVWIPQDRIYRHLGGDNLKSVLLASLYGVPLPLCSCSVIPTAVSLKESGASRGATAAFLISTPETGVDSISITYALLDPIMTVVRPLAAFLTALTTGSLVNFWVLRGWDAPKGEGQGDEPKVGDEESCCCSDKGEAKAEAQPEVDATAAPKPPAHVRLLDSIRYAFGKLLDDLTPWFILGFLLSGLIAVLIPEGFFENSVPRGWATSVLMLVIGTPMYICATASTPVAAALIAKGLDPGAALIFLLVGPATNITTLLVVSRFLGRRILVIYLVCIAGFALLLGATVNRLYAWLEVDLSAQVAGALEHGPGTFKMIAGILFLVLLLWSAKRIGLLPSWIDKIRRGGRRLGFDPGSRRAVTVYILVIAALYALTAFSIVGPGESGWVLRFGRVVRTVETPGLVVHWPAPMERVKTIRPIEVQSVELGFYGQDELAADPGPDELAARSLSAEAEMMTGEETLLRITYSVHYRVSDAYAYTFRIADPRELARAFAESAIRQVVGQKESADILVAHRQDIEAETARILQGELDGVSAGIEVVSVQLRDVHAPPEVHFAYRDVASAIEAQEEYAHQAERNRAEKLSDAAAESYESIQNATAFRRGRVQEATGKARAFEGVLEAYRGNREVTRLRLYLEAVEKALASTRNVFLMGDDVEIDLYKTKSDAAKDVKVFPPPSNRTGREATPLLPSPRER